jgi:arsenical pump membrane protein
MANAAGGVVPDFSGAPAGPAGMARAPSIRQDQPGKDTDQPAGMTRARAWGLRPALLAVGIAGIAATAAAAPREMLVVAGRAWPPFALVAGLLLVGVVANEDGVFRAAAAWLGRLPPGLATYSGATALVAGVTVVLNLDTSVAFLTPVLVLLARRQGASEGRLLYGCAFMSNSASLLLPGSNLTNLLILADEHISGSLFLARMVAPWAAAVLLTAITVWLAFPDHGGAQAASSAEPQPTIAWFGLAAIGVAVALMLTLADAALPVLVTGVLAGAVRLCQRRLRLAVVRERVDVLTLLGIFLLAVTLAAAGRLWAFPVQLMATANDAVTAATGAVAAVVVNNLPAAMLLGSVPPAHPRSLLLGLNIGPNLAVTGSLSAAIWWQAARAVGCRPSARRYSAVGIVLAPLALAAALLAERFTI